MNNTEANLKHFKTFEAFSKMKVSTSLDNSSYVYFKTDNNGKIVTTAEVKGTPDILYGDVVLIGDVKLFVTHGNYHKFEDMSEFVTYEDFAATQKYAANSIQKGTLGTINGKSLEKENITLDLSLMRIVDKLPDENIEDNKIYVIKSSDGNGFEEYIYHIDEQKWVLMGKIPQSIDLTGYLTKDEASKTYMKLTNGGATISMSNNGSVNNYGDNGQAFNAVRDVGTRSITGKRLNASSFGVKLDGTTAFSHKTYDSFNSTTGAYSGARNTAVLTFSGQSGLRYAKNTSSAQDVTDAMYKYVGVIDSPDEAQRVYSAKQVDEIIEGYNATIEELAKRIDDLEKRLG